MKGLLLAALMASATSTSGPIRVKSTEMGSEIDPSTGHIKNRESTFNVGQRANFFVFTEGNARNATITTQWVHWSGKTFEYSSVKDLNAQSNRIGGWYRVDPGDPTGAYSVRVYVNGKLLAEGTFTVLQPPPPPSTTSQPMNPSARPDPSGAIIFLALLLLGGIGAAFALTGGTDGPRTYDDGRPVRPNPTPEPPNAAPRPRPSGPRKLEIEEMIELRSKLLFHLNNGGTLPSFVAWMKAQSFVDAQIVAFGDWLETYEAELEKKAEARKRAEATAQSEEFMRAKAVLGWDGKPMTEDAFKAFRKAVFRKWHPDRRQVYVDMGWSSEDFERASRQATEAVAFIEGKFVAG